MKALITMREEMNRYGDLMDVLEHSYIKFWETEMGAKLFPISNLQSLDDKLLKEVDVIIFTGGGSVPSKYFSLKQNRTEQANRDVIEKELLEYAINNKKPLIGICRGMQYINCLLGGGISTLDNRHSVGSEHKIFTAEGVCYSVNSFHNDGILCGQLAEELLPIAFDESKTIVEAYVHKSNKIIGIQWHPERRMIDNSSVQYSISLMKEMLIK